MGRKKQIDEATGDDPVSKQTSTAIESKPATDEELDAKMKAYKEKYMQKSDGFNKAGR